MFLGRHREREEVDQVVAAVREGGSRVLVVRGEPGIGKSALLDYAAERSAGLRVAAAVGVQSEMEFAFSGLHQLCAPMLDRLDRLPSPQRDALGTAFGLAEGPPPDRFLIGLAVLGLLSEVAGERPLVCLVDDVQWLDRASSQILEFVARRLFAERIAMIFATRRSGTKQPLAGLPELVLEGLDVTEARSLLGTVTRWPLDVRVRDRIVSEARGNPLALMELPRGLTPAQLAGGFGLPVSATFFGSIEDTFRRRFDRLPPQTRRLVLLAAAEPTGDSALLWRAANRLGIDPDAADAAESADLLVIGARTTFRHPLVRSAVYRSTSPNGRRETQRALAAVTDAELDPDRRAWHLAQAAPGPDETVAAQLERSASRARTRGGLAAAAAFLERSAALTLDPGRRAERQLAAAKLNTQAGLFDAASQLLDVAESGPLPELGRAHADLVRGRIAFASSHGTAAPQLLGAAKRLEPLDARLSREAYLEAVSAAVFAARFGAGGGLREAAESARTAPPAARPGAADLLLDGLAVLIAEGPAAAAPTLKRALTAFSGNEVPEQEALRWLWLACPVAQLFWDGETMDLLSARQIQLARDAGALGVLPVALWQRAGLLLQQGDFAAASLCIEEASSVIAATASRLPPYAPLGLAAFRGREREAAPLIEAARDHAGIAPAFVHWAAAVLANSLGRYEDAMAAARQAMADDDELVFATWAALELIEAATHAGARAEATGAFERISETAEASRSECALGIEATARALLSDEELWYRRALDHLGRTRDRMPLARAHLLYGEWLRRRGRRADARTRLRTAHDMFVAMGAEGFAERARRELMATGETARRRATGSTNLLTPQEGQIARLARDGLTNPEIGAQLFISAHTVQYHLRKVFGKLDIKSRLHLAQALDAVDDGN